MPEITTLFWDVGGVILTNGWDRVSRQQAVQQFGLDLEDFQDRHELTFPAYEIGQIGLEEYLDRTIFFCSRGFSREQFKSFMFAQSKGHPDVLAILDRIARSGKYLQGTINNEGLELNQFRIQRFGLRKSLSVFISSCFVGVRKPDEGIYRIALRITQRAPEECLFIDDRPLNLECARRLGMRVIEHRIASQLEAEVLQNGVGLAPAS